MATPTLAKSPAPNDSQPYDGKLIDELTELVERVEEKKPAQSVPTEDDFRKQNEKLLLAAWYVGNNFATAYFTGFKKRIAQELLEQCEYEHPESHWGECNGGFRCGSRGVVHDLASDLDLCLAHFRKMN
jgi:hypothetical protein